jgi:hypothetical protein
MDAKRAQSSGKITRLMLNGDTRNPVVKNLVNISRVAILIHYSSPHTNMFNTSVRLPE